MIRKMNMIYLSLVMLSPLGARTQKSGQSSEEYLQKVMVQLQRFNVPSNMNIYDRLSLDAYRNMISKNKEKQGFSVQRINMNPRQNLPRYRNQSLHRYNVFPGEKIDLHRADSDNFPQYYQTRAPAISEVREPEVLGFTRAELAAMYKSALEKGSTMSLSSLTNALASGEMPQVTETHVEFPAKQPHYQYYFFPLKTFMSEFKRDHGYKTIPAPATFDNTEAAQTTQTQLSHPLFVAISTFVTMAVVFMMSVLFLPRLAQLDILHSRGMQDDFLYLSNIVLNAIERYNLLEKFKEHRVDSIR